MGLSELAELYMPQVRRLIENSANTHYTAFHASPNASAFDQIAPVKRPQVLELMRSVYTLGLLERSHLAAITSLTRQCKWLEAAVAMKQASNALAFAATLRGFLEAAADANDVMQYLPSFLSNNAAYFYAVFERPELVDQTMIVFKDLEQRLIHYAFASRRPRVGPILPDHEVSKTTDYIRDFEKSQGVPGIEALYAHLCEITHPAAASVFAFLHESDANTEFRPDQDAQLIDEICNQHKTVIQEVVSRGFNAPILVLSMLGLMVDDWPTAPIEWVGSIGTFATRLQNVKQSLAFASNPECTADDIKRMSRGS